MIAALAQVSGNIGATLKQYGALQTIPADQKPAVRNEMYLAAETIKRLQADRSLILPSATQQNLQVLKTALNSATQFIPTWVKHWL